jgi:hypothetical protein
MSLPESGTITRGVFEPGAWRLMLRLVTCCRRCDRRVVHWRKIGVDGTSTAVVCNGESADGCRDFRIARAAAHQMASGKKFQRKRAARAGAAEARAEVEARRAREDAIRAGRRARCPRPDKDVWLTLEAAEVVVAMMRRAGRPRAKDLHGYECVCGAFHVGNRTSFAGDPVVERWGSAYGEAS